VKSIEPLTISVHGPGDQVTICVAGELDVFAVPQLWAAIRGVPALGAPVIVLDLEGITFIDARGIDTLVKAAIEVRERGGRLTIRRPSSVVVRMERLVGPPPDILALDQSG